MKKLLEGFVARDAYCLRCFVRASQGGRWKAVEESQVPAKTPGSGESARNVFGGDCGALGTGDPCRQARPLPGERGTGGAQKQSPRPRDWSAVAGRLQPDPLSGTPRTVHGIYFQPDGQIAIHHRIRQRGRPHESAVQCAVAGGRLEQRLAVRDPDRLRGIHNFRGLRRAASSRGS